MTNPKNNKPTGWKKYLEISEQLLVKKNTKDQKHFLISTIQHWINCQADLWLARPLFPIPGDPFDNILPDSHAPQLVEKIYKDFQNIANLPHPESTADVVYNETEAALPLISENSLLGVIHIIKKKEHPYTDQDRMILEGIAAFSTLSFQISRQVKLKNLRAEQLMLVQAVSEKISNFTDTEELCREAVKTIQHSFNYYYVGIYTLDTDSDILHLRSSIKSGMEPGEFDNDFKINIGEGIIGHVAQHGEHFYVPNVKSESQYRYVDSLSDTISEFALPLKVENTIIGVLDVQSNQQYAFHEIDRTVLKALANNIALAIDSVNLYQDVQQRADQIQMILEFNHALTSILDLDVLVDKVIQMISDRLGFPFVHVYTIHPIRKKIIYSGGAGARSQAMQDFLITYDLDDSTGIIPWVARNAKSFLSNDVHKEPLYRESQLPPINTQSELTVPISSAGEVIGILDIQSDLKNAFSNNDCALIESLAASTAIAIRNASMYRSEQWRVQVANSFREVSIQISENIRLDDVLDSILEKLENNLPCDSSAIWLMDEAIDLENIDQTILKLAAVRGIKPDEIIDAMKYKETYQKLLETITAKEPIIRDPETNYGPLGKANQYPQDYSSIAAPLIAGGQPMGILALAHHTPGRYGKEAFDMVTTFASYAAVAIQNARFYEETQEQAWVSTVLLQVAEASQSITSVDELLSTMVRLPPLLIGVKLSAIFIWDENIEAWQLKEWYGFEKDPPSTIFNENMAPIFSELDSDRSLISISNMEDSFGISKEYLPENLQNILLIPLLSKGNLIGGMLIGLAMNAQPGREQSYFEQTQSILQGIAQQTAIALENLRLEEAQEEEAYVTAVLLEAAQAVVSQNDLDNILDTIVHLMPILVGIDACVIYLQDHQTGEMKPAQAFSSNAENEIPLLSSTFKSGEFNLLDQIAETNQTHFSFFQTNTLNLDEWTQRECYQEEMLMQRFVQPGNYLLFGFPLSVKGEILGVLLAWETFSNYSFQQRRMEIVNGIARQLSLAIQNEQYKLEMVETERIEQEFRLARQSQQTFLPNELPHITGWDSHALWIPARQVGGDFYDVIPLDNNHFGLVIADVADKGMPAALYMTVTRTLIRAYAQSELSPSTVLENVNNLLIPDTQDGMFITVFYAIIERKSGKVVYCSAGHNPPFVMRNEINEIIKLEKGGMALGVIENLQLNDRETMLNKGDCLFMYTDGITEAMTEAGQMFGEEKMVSVLKDTMHGDIKSVLLQMQQGVIDFRGNAAPSDDLTMLGVKRTQ